MARPLRLDEMTEDAAPEAIAGCRMKAEDLPAEEARYRASVAVSGTFSLENVGRVPMHPDAGYPTLVRSLPLCSRFLLFLLCLSGRLFEA